jgi:hypothetical protein
MLDVRSSRSSTSEQWTPVNNVLAVAWYRLGAGLVAWATTHTGATANECCPRLVRP